MKIAQCIFQISKVGGIATVARELKGGLEDNGHECVNYFVSSNKQVLPDPPSFCDKTIGYMTEKLFQDAIDTLKGTDLFVFNPPCPTLTKAYTSRKWQSFFTDFSQPKLIVPHDPYLMSHYKWLLEVKEHIDGVACVQKKAYDPMKEHFFKIEIINHPMNLQNIGFYDDEKEDLVICPHQFKTWKHIDKFISAVPQITYGSEIYNGGIEYHYMSGTKRKEKYKNSEGEWIWDKAIAHGMKYLGFVDDITSAYKRAKCVIDLSVGELGSRLSKVSKYRSLNYVPLEAMMYGAIPVVREYSLLSDIITKDNVVLVDESDLVNSTAKKVNEVIENYESFTDMISRNHDLLRKFYDRKENAKKLLDIFNKKEKTKEEQDYEDMMSEFS